MSGKVNKRGFAEEIAFEHGLSVNEALSLIDTYNNTLVRLLVTGKNRVGADIDGVSMTGLGIFERVKRAERWARNPQTGDRVKVAAITAVRFRPGQALAKMVAGKMGLPVGRGAAAKAPKSVPSKKVAAALAAASEKDQ
jgi:DNA-binding protein HU-beta